MDTFTAYKPSEGNEWVLPFLKDGRYFDFSNHSELTHWMKLSRAFVDLHQLFRIYLWNYSQLANGLHLNVDGRVNKAFDNGTDQPSLICVNGYAMNCISSGVNLVNHLKSICTREERSGFNSAGELKELLSPKPDDDPNYALAQDLRNYSQHGQLIVSMHSDDNVHDRVCLDLFQLLNADFVGMNSDTRKRFQIIYDSLRDREDGPVRLSFTRFISSFHMSVCNLYKDSLSFFHPYILEHKERVDAILKNSKEKVLATSDLSYFIILLEKHHDGDVPHLIIGSPDESVALLQQMEEEAAEKLFDAKEKLDTTNQCFRPLISNQENKGNCKQ